MIETDLKVKDQFIGHHAIYKHPYEWDEKLENSLSDFHKRYKTVVKEFNSLPPEEQLSEEGIKKRDKIIELHGRIKAFEDQVQDFKNEDIRTFARIEKYFNSESLKHIVIFSLICLILKGLEVYGLSIWNEVKTLYRSNSEYFILIYGVIAFIYLNRLNRWLSTISKTYEAGPK